MPNEFVVGMDRTRLAEYTRYRKGLEMTLDELKDKTTISVEEAAPILGISRGAAYQAAKTGELPTLRIGRRIVVPVIPLLKLIGVEE